MISFEHTPPLIILLLATAAALAAGVSSAWRLLPHSRAMTALPALFGASLAALFWCMLLPASRRTGTHLIKPRFIVALDTSQSMTVRPNEQAEPRWNKALRALDLPWGNAVGAEADIDVYPFDREPGPRRTIGEGLALAAPRGTSTRLHESLRELTTRFTGLSVAGMLLLSDGNDTHEANDIWAANPLPFPVFTVRLEDPAEWILEPDIRVDTVITPRRVALDRESELKAMISGQGTGGATVAVRLYRNDIPVDEVPAQIPVDGGQRDVVFTLRNTEIGTFSYRVHIPPLPGEKQIGDNDYHLTVAVTDPRNRLLYAEGVPRFEYRFLRRVLLADDQIVPAIFFTGADGRPVAGAPADHLTAEMTEADLLQFKIVILGNLDADELTDTRARHLVRFVETGGSLVLLGGTRGWGPTGFLRTALRTILPVRAHELLALEGETPFPVRIEPEALAHPAFAGDAALWDTVPPVLSVFAGAEINPGAMVLVTVDTPRGWQPLVVSQRYGQGRVAAIFTDTLWRWQLSPDSAQRQPYARFWTQLLAWMLPETGDDERRRIELFTAQDQVHIGESVEISARFTTPDLHNGAMLEARITQPDGRIVPYTMISRQGVTPAGRAYPGFFLDFKPEEPGHYTVAAGYGTGSTALASVPISFNVRSYSPETAPRPINENVLRTIASSSGGRYFETLESLDIALANLRIDVTETRRAEFSTLWRRWIVLVPLMLLFAGTWLLRKIHHLS